MASETKRREPRSVRAFERATENREARIDSRAERHQSGELKGQQVRSAAEKLLVRVLYGAIYAVAVIGCLFLGVVPTAAIVAVMSWLCASEFFHLMRTYGRMPNEVLALTASAAFPFVVIFGIRWTAVASFIFVLCLAVWYVSNPRSSIADVAVTFFGACYTGLLFSSLVVLRGVAYGDWLCVGVIGSIWANDSFAYLVGSLFGVHKMAPKISPKKSWEGAIGGFLGCIAVWVLLSLFWQGQLPMSLAVACGSVVCVTSVVGDLVESRIKRGAGVKDSGNLIPGHGGMLDRSDSLLFGCATALLVLALGGVL